MNIGQVIRRHRVARGWTMQELADRAEGDAWPSHISRIERGQLKPAFPLVVSLARALELHLDDLIREAEGDEEGPSLPTETRAKVPLMPWRALPEWLEKGDIKQKDICLDWIMPPVQPRGDWFALPVTDDSMSTSAGTSFSFGATIIVDPSREPQVGDFVVAVDTRDGRTAGSFRQLLSDGTEQLFKPLNPAFPSRLLTTSGRVVGVVVAQVLDLSSKGLANM